MIKTCLYCQAPVPKGRRKYCSDKCSRRYWEEKILPLWWGNAAATALRRTGGLCEECGSSEKLEVHHLVPLAKGESRHNSLKNVQSNLMVLCLKHHTQIHHPPKSGWPLLRPRALVDSLQLPLLLKTA